MTATMKEIERLSVLELKGASGSTYDELLDKGDFNWEVKEGPCLTSHPRGGTIEMPRKKVLYRSDNYAALGVVGSDYKPSCPKEFLRSQFELAEEIGGKVTRAGWTERRSKAFATIRLDHSIKVGKVRRKGDIVSCFLYSTDGWDGGTPRQSKIFVERLACLNGMTTRDLAQSIWVSHTSEMETRYEIEIGKFRKAISDQIESLEHDYQRLADRQMNEGGMKEFLDKLLPGDSGITNNKKEQILHLFGGGTENAGATAWDALNAVTEYTTHIQTYRDSKIADAETSRFLGVLGRNHLNDRAMDLLLTE